VRSAAVTWLREQAMTPSMRRLLARLACEHGPMPSQDAADAWARKHTDGLIDAYPVDVTNPALLLTMATALLTRVTWITPFDVVGAAELGPGPFTSQVRRAMRARPGNGHRLALSDTEIGVVAVHHAEANGLHVVSVAADPETAAADVLDTAYRIAGGTPGGPVDLWDLPLGEGPAWTIAEEQALVHGDRDQVLVDVTVPAWSATSTHELVRLDPGLGFSAAGQVLAPLLHLDDFQVEAVQSAAARYHPEGFEAAAVTAVGMRAGAARLPGQSGVRRVARLRFGHPYAVVAVAAPTDWRQAGRTPWDGVPVFSAWVRSPEEPEARGIPDRR